MLMIILPSLACELLLKAYLLCTYNSGTYVVVVCTQRRNPLNHISMSSFAVEGAEMKAVKSFFLCICYTMGPSNFRSHIGMSVSLKVA